MKKAMLLIYDGSFNGFLTAVFTAFEERIHVADIQANSLGQSRLFSETRTVFTQMDKAKRVWDGLQSRSHYAVKSVYFGFLSERNGIELLLYKYIVKLCAPGKLHPDDFLEDQELKIRQLAKMVGREKQRIEDLTKFQLTRDGVYFSKIESEFNVLPLVSKHFRSRYPDQQWILYDTKRKYGLYYNGSAVEIVSLEWDEILGNRIGKSDAFLRSENRVQKMMDNSLQGTNIKSRIQRKLRTHPGPKRRSKYAGERKAV